MLKFILVVVFFATFIFNPIHIAIFIHTLDYLKNHMYNKFLETYESVMITCLLNIFIITILFMILFACLI